MEEQRVTEEGLAEEATTPIVERHSTSMAVWDVPSPSVVDSRMAIKIGVSCSAGCPLAGAEVEVYDHPGAKVASGVLGDNPWSGSGSLYWTEVELKAPGADGYYEWRARFPEQGSEPSHVEASHRFGFRTVNRPEHTVTLEVTEKDTNAPIADAQIFLHPYRGRSDERGMSSLMVPKGEYDLQVLATGMQSFEASVVVSGDAVVKLEMLVAPPVKETYP